jgi:hypothetical protein
MSIGLYPKLHPVKQSTLTSQSFQYHLLEKSNIGKRSPVALEIHHLVEDEMQLTMLVRGQAVAQRACKATRVGTGSSEALPVKTSKKSMQVEHPRTVVGLIQSLLVWLSSARHCSRQDQ